MGVSCCTHQKDAPEIITVVEPEKNINIKKREDILSKENQQNNLIIVNPNENNITDSNGIIIPINDSKINNINNPNRIINLENPLDINTLLNSEISNKNPLEFGQKEIDDIFSQAIKNSNIYENENTKYDNTFNSNLNSNSIQLLDKSPLGGLNINEYFQNQNYNINTSQKPTQLENINYDDLFKNQGQNQNQTQMNNLNINYNDNFGQQQNNNNNQGGLDLNSLLNQNQNQNLIPNSSQENIDFQNYQNNFNIPQQVQTQNQIVKSVNMLQYKQYSPLNSPSKTLQYEQMSPYNPLYISQHLPNNVNIL
jgi:hypothetical protein